MTTNLDAAVAAMLPEIRSYAQSEGRFDSANTPFFGRLLASLESTIYRVLTPDTSYSKLMASSTKANLRGAASYSYAVADKVGGGKVINPYVPTKDLPSATVVLREETAKLESFGASYFYTLAELDRAALQASMGLSFNLELEKMAAAYKSHEYRFNHVALFGSTEANTKGLLNNTDIASAAVAADGTGDATTWASKTGALIIRDIADRIVSVKQTSKGVHTPNTLALTPKALEQLRSKPYSTTANKSTFAYFKETYPELAIIEVPELEAAFSAADGFIVYERNATNLEFVIVKPVFASPPQYGGLAYTVETSSEYVAECIVRYPKAIAVGTGV